jgi:hypothetical protein
MTWTRVMAILSLGRVALDVAAEHGPFEHVSGEV